MRHGRAALLIATTLCGASYESRALADAPAPAADAPADAEALIAKGVALRHEGKDAEALKVFRRAYDQTPSARARAQMGLAEQALGMWVEAERDLVAALADPSDAWVRQYKDPLQSSLTAVKARLGSLEIVVNVPKADVLVDGANVGTVPGPALRVVAGSRTVLVRADAHHPISRTVVVPGGGVARETFELAPLPPPDATSAEGGARAEPAAGAGGEGAPATSQRTLGWALVGGGALVLVGGGVAQVVQQIAVRDYNDYGNQTCPGAASPTQPPPCDSLLAKANRWQTVAIVGFATGGALAIAGTILLVTAPRAASSSPPPRTATACNGVPTTNGFGAAFVCEGRF